MRTFRLILILCFVQLGLTSGLWAGSVSGRVTYDGNGQPVGMAQILVFSASGQGFGIGAVTNSDGYYEADEVPAGDFVVTCTKIDLATKTYYSEYYDNAKTREEATVLHVNTDSKITNINFGIPGGGVPPVNLEVIVKGTVKDANGNALQNAIVKIWLGRISDHLLWFSKDKLLSFITAKTDASGKYEIKFEKTANIVNWIVVSAEKDNYLTEFYKNKAYFYQATPIVFNSDTTLSGIDFSLSPCGSVTSYSISGTLTGSDGKNLSGAFIIATNGHIGDTYMAVADDAGKYKLSNLKSGKYYLLFAAHGYVLEFYNNEYKWEDADAVQVNGAVSGINAELDVMPDKSGGCVVSGIIKALDDSFIPGVLITIKNSAGKAVSSAITDDNGKYQISDLPDGAYTLQASKVDFESKTADVSVSGSNSAQVNLNLKQTATSVETGGKIIPTELKLIGNYPNPFNPSTTISFTLPSQEFTSLKVYNMLGQEVASLVNEKLDAGVYKVNFNAGQLSSGVYLYQLSAGSYSSVMKMVLMK